MADEEEPQQPLNPDLMGYPSVEALVAAKRASDQEALKLRQRADRADELERMLMVQAQGAANPRQAIPDRSKPGWYQRLETLGIPPDDILEAIRDGTRGIVQEELQPVFRIGTARSEVLAEHPDYAKYESDVGAFVNSDPKIQESYAKMFAADPGRAVEWAWLKFGANRRKTVQHGATTQETAEGAVHAAIPSQRAGDARGKAFNADVGIEEARRAWQENPSRVTAERYARERLRHVITDEHLLGGSQ